MKTLANAFVSGMALSLVFASGAFANDSRVDAMGGERRLLDDDNALRFVYPGHIADYQGVNIENGSSVTVAHAMGDGVFGAHHDMTDGNNWLTLMYGTEDYGAIVSIDQQSDAGDDAASNMGLGIQYGAEMFGGDFAIGFDYGSNDPGGEDSESTSSMGFGIDYRGSDGMMGDWNNMGPLVTLNYGSNADETSDMSLSLGVGGNHAIGDNGTVVTGCFVGFGSETPAEGDGVSMITLPRLVVGAEYDIANWFGYDVTLRGGASRWSTLSDGAWTNGMTSSMGMGVGNDHLAIDGVLADDVLTDGPYIVGGNANGLFGQLSVTYSW